MNRAESGGAINGNGSVPTPKLHKLIQMYLDAWEEGRKSGMAQSGCILMLIGMIVGLVTGVFMCWLLFT